MKIIPTLFIALLLLISASAFRFKAKTNSQYYIDELQMKAALGGLYDGYLSKHNINLFIYASLEVLQPFR